jgi:hypothetical protein
MTDDQFAGHHREPLRHLSENTLMFERETSSAVLLWKWNSSEAGISETTLELSGCTQVAALPGGSI